MTMHRPIRPKDVRVGMHVRIIMTRPTVSQVTEGITQEPSDAYWIYLGEMPEQVTVHRETAGMVVEEVVELKATRNRTVLIDNRGEKQVVVCVGADQWLNGQTSWTTKQVEEQFDRELWDGES